MKNIFVKTALALFLIPGFLLTSVVSAQADGQWVYVKKDTLLGPLVGSYGKKGTLSEITIFHYGLNACGISWMFATSREHAPNLLGQVSNHTPKYYQWLDGVCYYYEAGSSSGKTGDYTYRWDE